MEENHSFKCLKCGHCCTNLITKTDPSQGLALYPFETHLFPKEYIVPSAGLGKSPKHKRFEITSYQFTKNVCVHYNSNRCEIYDKRPLHCVAFPFEVFVRPSIKRTYINPKRDCTFIDRIYKEFIDKPPKDVINTDSVEFKAAISINFFTKEKFEKHGHAPLWFFDVKKRKWVKSSETDARELILFLSSLE